LALEFISFPQGVAVTPSSEQVFDLAMIQGPFVALLMIIPFGIFSLYKIDRKRHEEILRELEVS